MAELSTYSFLPWMRQGISSQIKDKDTYAQNDGTVDERAQLDVKIRLKQTDVGENPLVSELDVEKTIRIIGPGDVIGVSDRAIVRTEPRKGVTNYESNAMVYIEFYEEDFAWRYTPASAGNSGNAAHRLRPWLALIVLKEGEYTLVENKVGLPSIKIDPTMIDEVLHSEKDTWAWAHVHMNHTIKATTDPARINEVTQELESEPDSGVSRLLCPRKLSNETRYEAFLIPAFETGRLAGLGEDPAGVKAQMPAWKKGSTHQHPDVRRPFEFPLYHRWNFNTGKYGDFESLVAMLKPVIVKPELGKRPMDIQSPGFNLNGVAKSKLLGMEGALKPPNFTPDAWPNNTGSDPGSDPDFISRIGTIINLSNDLQQSEINVNPPDNPFFSEDIGIDPVVTPPIYGKWHAFANKVDNTSKAWLRTLNLDPRNRAAAGLGTSSVQEHQEDLMHQAWTQIGEVKTANSKILEGQLVKKINMCLFKKHVARGTDDYMINLTSLVHNQLKFETVTLKQKFSASRVPLAANTAAFKRIIRPGKKVNRRMNANGTGKINKQLITNFNLASPSDVLTAAKLKQAPLTAVGFGDAQTTLAAVITNYQGDPKNVAKEVFFNILQPTGANVPGNAVLKNRANNAQFNGAPITAEARNRVNALIDAITARAVQNGIARVTLEEAVFVEYFDNVPQKYLNKVTLLNGGTPDADKQSAPTVTLSNLVGLQTNFAQFSNVTATPAFSVPQFKPAIASVAAVSSTLKSKLNPGSTIQKRVLQNIKVWSPALMKMVPHVVLKPVMAYPKFGQPTFEYLKKISQDYVMPNIDQVDKNSITIVQTNQKFIEAYMAGLNHEMSRELMWREYVTDQRGSYFRQFWDVKDNLREGDEEDKLDITKMHTWNKDLGRHNNRPLPPGAEPDEGYLVLLIRGDVFKKYPNTMVYAQKARYNPDDPEGQRILPDDLDKDVEYPIFHAELEPDVNLFGFDLSIEIARGHRGDTDPGSVGGTLNPGYFFVLRERPGQIRFGLDDFTDPLGNTDVMPPAGPLESWNDLSWEHTVNSKSALQSYHLDFKKNLTIDPPPVGEPHAKWKSNAADMAWILYQNPVIFARHAGEMLPED